MSNRLAFLIVLLIAAAITADVILHDGEYTLYLARKLADLIEYLAFWR
ncbi:hypothetical protein [Actibacterium ureilyticum]|nr:hypothetical protein [Actibacterium ureilyticum]